MRRVFGLFDICANAKITLSFRQNFNHQKKDKEKLF